MGNGKPRRLLVELLDRHQIVSSRQMLAEFAAVMAREKLTRVTRAQVDAFLSILIRGSVLVTVRETENVIVEDPDDNIVLATALEGGASHIVSGDRHLLKLKRFRTIRIVTVAEMLNLPDL